MREPDNTHLESKQFKELTIPALGSRDRKEVSEMTRLRRAMALWGRTIVPFFKGR